MINAGKYNKIIEFWQITQGKDSAGYPSNTESKVLTTYAEVKTTRGFTLIVNDSDFFAKEIKLFTVFGAISG